MIDKGQWREFGQDTGVTPLLFTRSAMGFLMTTKSQDISLTSHTKDTFKRILNLSSHFSMVAYYSASPQKYKIEQLFSTYNNQIIIRNVYWGL